MALDNGLKFTQNINGLEGIVEDTTSNYGVSGNPTRESRANYLLYSKNDENGDREYYTDIVNSLPLSQLSWTVTTDVSTVTQATLLRINIWTSIIAYVKEAEDSQGIITTYASVIYYTPTNKVYKAIENGTDKAPDGAEGSLYWEEVTDLTTLVGYESVEQFSEEFLVDYSVNQCVTKGFLNICDCSSFDELEQGIRNWALYMSAVANFQNEAANKADDIIEQLNKICSTC